MPGCLCSWHGEAVELVRSVGRGSRIDDLRVAVRVEIAAGEQSPLRQRQTRIGAEINPEGRTGRTVQLQLEGAIVKLGGAREGRRSDLEVRGLRVGDAEGIAGDQGII